MAFVRGLIAMVSSLCLGVGVGHSALGRPLRGLGWCVAVLCLLAMSALRMELFAVAALAWLGGLVDAFVCGYRTSNDPPFRWLRISTIAIFVGSVAVALLLRLFVVESFKVPSSSMYPTLEIGDHVFVRRGAATHRGDLIAFKYPCDPSRDYIKRTIALGGDTVEVRCNVVYVNSAAVPSKLVAESGTYDEHDERTDQWFPRTVSRYRETLGDATYDIFDEIDRPAADKQPIRAQGSIRDFPMRMNPAPPSCADVYDGPAIPALGRIVETKHEAEASACEPQLHYVVPPDHVFVMGDNRANSNDSRVWGSVPIDAVRGRVVGIWWTNRPGASIRSRFGSVR
jgi:signal peptidase I